MQSWQTSRNLTSQNPSPFTHGVHDSASVIAKSYSYRYIRKKSSIFSGYYENWHDQRLIPNLSDLVGIPVSMKKLKVFRFQMWDVTIRGVKSQWFTDRSEKKVRQKLRRTGIQFWQSYSDIVFKNLARPSLLAYEEQHQSENQDWRKINLTFRRSSGGGPVAQPSPTSEQFR